MALEIRATMAGLRRELKRLIEIIVDDDDYSTGTVDQAMQTLTSLNNKLTPPLPIKLRKISEHTSRHSPPPLSPKIRRLVSGKLEQDPEVLAQTIGRLKEQLVIASSDLLSGRENSNANVHQVMQILQALKSLKPNRIQDPASFSFPELAPWELMCRISGKIMKEPVVIASGQTYDKDSIQNWLSENRTCPQTGEELLHTVVTPNHLAKKRILGWYKKHDTGTSDQVEERYVEDEPLLSDLLEQLNSYFVSEKQLSGAVKELRLLTGRRSSLQFLLGEPIFDSITEILSALLMARAGTLPDLQEDVIGTILNMSVHLSHKRLIGEHQFMMLFLFESLQSENSEVRRLTAAVLSVLSQLDTNRAMIGKSSVLRILIGMVEEGDPFTMRDAASALDNLCKEPQNQGDIVSLGAVKLIMKKIKESVHLNEFFSILETLTSHEEAVEEMRNLGAVHCLLHIMRDHNDEYNNKKSAAILCVLCGAN